MRFLLLSVGVALAAIGWACWLTHRHRYVPRLEALRELLKERPAPRVVTHRPHVLPFTINLAREDQERRRA